MSQSRFKESMIIEDNFKIIKEEKYSPFNQIEKVNAAPEEKPLDYNLFENHVFLIKFQNFISPNFYRKNI